MPAQPPFDLIILGAGPAGSAAAMTARHHGLSVALVDKADFPRNKLCGGLVTGRAKRYFSEIFGQDLASPLIETRDRVRFYFDGVETGEMTDIPPLHLTMRWDFDNHLLRLALAAGAEPYLGRRVSGIDPDRPALTLDDGTTLAGRILIGADGVNSAVARAVFGRAYDPETVGFALEQEMPAETDPGAIRIDFGVADYGYGWSFPKRGCTTFGVAGLHARNPDMKARYHAYATLCGQGQTSGLKGHFLPFGSYRTPPGRAAVLLAGDAAGLVDPITGEGIAYAMKSGELAALAAASALTTGTPESALRQYQTALKPIHRSIWLANLLRPAIFSRLTGPTFAKSFTGSKGHLRGAYLRMLAGDQEYPDLIVQVIGRVPGLLWRSLRRH